MYFPYFHSFITYFILVISRSNFAQIQWSWTFFNSQDDELFKNVQDFRIWVKFDRVIVKKTLVGFFWLTLYNDYNEYFRRLGHIPFKDDILRHVSNPFLCNIREPKYKQNNVGHQIGHLIVQHLTFLKSDTLFAYILTPWWRTEV